MTILHKNRDFLSSIFWSSSAPLDVSAGTAEMTTPPEPSCLRGICHVHWRIKNCSTRCSQMWPSLCCFPRKSQNRQRARPNFLHFFVFLWWLFQISSTSLSQLSSFRPWNGRERKQSLDANITHKEFGILLFNYILIIVTQLEMFRHSLGMH